MSHAVTQQAGSGRQLRPAPAKMPIRILTATLTATGLVALNPSHANTLNALSEAAKETVIERCLPVRFDTGVEAWRSCVESEAVIAAASTGQRNIVPLDEKFAVQLACESDPGTACQQQTLQALRAVPEPVLDDLSVDERHALARACRSVLTDKPIDSLQIGSWRTCLNEQAEALRSGPVADITALNLLERQAVLGRCAATNDLSDYRNCLITAGTPAGASSTEVAASEQVSEPSVAAALPATDQNTVRAADLIKLPTVAREVDTATPTDTASQNADTAPVQAVDSGNEQDTANDQSAPPGPAAQLLETVKGLDTNGRLMLLAAGMLPLIALIGILVSRRFANTSGSRDARYAHEPYSNEPFPNEAFANEPYPYDLGAKRPPHSPKPASRARPAAGPDTVAIHQRFSDEADALFEALDATISSDPLELVPSIDAESSADSFFETSEFARDETDDFHLEESEFHDVDIPPTERVQRKASPQEAPTRLVSHNDAMSADNAQEENAQDENAQDEPERTATAEVRTVGFADWLVSVPESDRQQYVIELLIYWVAYADDRYEPELKQTVLADSNPDSHSRIKAWVLRKEARALTEAVRWVLHNSSREQRVQIIELLIVLLITDAYPTPVQNTLLRFLSDVFGLGDKRLNQLWLTAFDTDLPSLARVDRLDWWQAQGHHLTPERDARVIAKGALDTQYRVRLGLPLHTELSTQAIEFAWQLAAARCQPSRFDALSSRERQLVEKQRHRCDEAREALTDSLPGERFEQEAR